MEINYIGPWNYIWKEPCRRIFENKDMDASQLLSVIVQDIQTLHTALGGFDSVLAKFLSFSLVCSRRSGSSSSKGRAFFSASLPIGSVICYFVLSLPL